MLAKHLLPIEETPEATEFANQQLKIFWLPEELKVEIDIQDVIVNCTPAEKHGVISTLKLFSLYETHAGDEYWGFRFKQMFDGAEWHKMASVFSMFELAVHAPFYNKINELLHINTPEFYMSYVENSVLKARMEHIAAIIDDEDDLVSLAGFSMVEGVILYSNFAFLKHFQANGKNRLNVVVRGINFSVRDENLHSLAGAFAFKTKLAKANLSEYKKIELVGKLIKLSDSLYEHECEIIDMIFSEGPIDGINAEQLKAFVRSRINVCFAQLGFEPLMTVGENPIADWFYKGINNFQFNDFFAGVGNQYHRDWDEDGFTW